MVPAGEQLPPVEKKVSIYTLSDPETGEVRYVGKAINAEGRLGAHLKDKGKNHKANWIKGLKARGLVPVMEVLEEVCEFSWQESEMFWIETLKFYGFKLTNLTAGGEGNSNWNPPEKWRKSQSASKKGKPQSPELVAKRTAAIKAGWGYKMTDASRKKMSHSARNRKYSSEENKAAVLANLDAYRKSDANKKNSGNLMRRLWTDPAFRDKMILSSKTHRHSVESIAKMKASWVKRKENKCLA
jgi:hypothetical protein